jgi:DNA topoisomerase-1
VAARAARLRYVSDQTPGIRRRRAGRGYAYVGPDNQRVTDAETLRRIKALAVPPAWIDVWICPHANGHIQATGRDARGRKQYRYHIRWRSVRDETKYGHLVAFGEALPLIRGRTEEHLSLPGLPREKVLATVVRLLEKSLIRVGNGEYARANGSVGLTTMRDGHVDISGSLLRFEFRGKSGIDHRVDVRDRRLAKLVKRCQDLPGEELFQYVDDAGERHSIASDDVNAYLRAIAGEDFTAKDFRTWAGTVLAARTLAALGRAESEVEAKRRIVRAVETVAGHLGNTPAVCRACYIHPAVLEAYQDGSLAAGLSGPAGADRRQDSVLRLLRGGGG